MERGPPTRARGAREAPAAAAAAGPTCAHERKTVFVYARPDDAVWFLCTGAGNASLNAVAGCGRLIGTQPADVFATCKVLGGARTAAHTIECPNADCRAWTDIAKPGRWKCVRRAPEAVRVWEYWALGATEAK